MFAKPQWFRQNRSAGLTPATLAGWGYVGTWLVAIAAPFSLLTFRGQPLEALLWMGAALGALAVDVRQLKRSLTPQPQPAAGPAVRSAEPLPDIQFIEERQNAAPSDARKIPLYARPVAALGHLAKRQAGRFRLFAQPRHVS